MPTASADDVLALHEELLALVKAGMPVEPGLRELSRDVPGRLQPLLADFAERLATGQSITAALAELPSPAARSYAAVLAAGMQSGHPAAALEGVVATARRTMDFRRAIRAELIYPLLVLVVGTGLIVFSLRYTAPVQAKVSEHFGAEGMLTNTLEQSSAAAPPPLVTLGVALALAVAALLLLPHWLGDSPLRTARWRPFRRLRQWQASAIFCDLAALLIENEVALPAALPLAGAATPWPPLSKAVERLAAQLSRGEQRIEAAWPLSPSIAWLLQRTDRASMVAGLRREAQYARRRMERLQHWLTVYLPMLIAAIGGLFCLIVLVTINLAPLVQLYYQLSGSNL